MSAQTLDYGGKTLYKQPDGTYNAKKPDALRIEANRGALREGPPKARKGGKAWAVGVDPSIRKNGLGVCVIKPDGEVTFPKFTGGGEAIVSFVEWLDTLPAGTRAVIENSNLQNATFDNSGNSNVRARKSRNVGMNQGVSVVLLAFLKDKLGKDNVKAVSPRSKGRKWNAETFARNMKIRNHTTSKKKSNQDERDAYQIALK